MKVVWSRRATSRVVEIARFIAQDSPQEAKRWVEGVFGAVEGLADFPETAGALSFSTRTSSLGKNMRLREGVAEVYPALGLQLIDAMQIGQSPFDETVRHAVTWKGSL